MNNKFSFYSLFAPISLLRHKKFSQNFCAIICNFSLLLNSFLPYIAAVPAYADEPEPTPIVEEISTPEVTPTAEPTNTEPVEVPTVTPEPTSEPTAIPTETPVEPTAIPTEEPIITPVVTETPTETPTEAPVENNNNNNQNPDNNSSPNSPAPSEIPTTIPSIVPTSVPTAVPITGAIDTTVVENNSCRTDILNPFINSDKADYHPTEIAIITGHDFIPNTPYTLIVTSDNLNQSYNIVSDATGSFTYSYQLDGTYRPNYTVEAKNSDGKILATTTFTDTPPPATCGDIIIGVGEQCDDGNNTGGDGCSPICQNETANLFFSEYIEGSSNSKAIEIYNASGFTVDLSGYSVAKYTNGAGSPTATINLTGNLISGDVYVLCHTSASPSILSFCDDSTGSLDFNGDDAIALRQGTNNIDVIGQIGFRPTSEWGSGLTSTQDNTLVRKCGTTQGDSNGYDSFDPAIEWDGYVTDTFSYLGSHNPTCVSTPTCGNGGPPEAGEQCDDGNTNPGDGCSATCQTEMCPCPLNWQGDQFCNQICNIGACNWDGGDCGSTCGNSHLETGEACDDGNTNNGDGCSAVCQIETDSDQDGISDISDNCQSTANLDQADADGDHVGNVCDNCPSTSNADQADADNDGYGDVCDNCATTPNPTQTDDDGDHLGNHCDPYNCIYQGPEVCGDLYLGQPVDNDCDGFYDEGCVDTTPPVITATFRRQDPSPYDYARVGDIVRVDVEADERISPQSMVIAGHSIGSYSPQNSEGTRLDFYYTMAIGDSEGPLNYSITAQDDAGNPTTIFGGGVTFDKTAPTATISYDHTTLTNSDVVATLNPSETVTVTNNGGSQIYTFTSNDTFTFEFTDDAGNTGTATATVNYIDKTAPTVTFILPTPNNGLVTNTNTQYFSVNVNETVSSCILNFNGNYAERQIANGLSDGTGFSSVISGDDQATLYNLPFNFSFYGNPYNNLSVSTNALLRFASPADASLGDSISGLLNRIGIAALWDDIVTTLTVNSSTDNVRFRWTGSGWSTGGTLTNEAVLRSNGTVELHYGDVNLPGRNFTAGLSAGNGTDYVLAGVNGQSTVSPISFAYSPGASASYPMTLNPDGTYTVVVPGIPDGTINYSVVCRDLASNDGTSASRTLTVDTSVPYVEPTSTPTPTPSPEPSSSDSSSPAPPPGPPVCNNTTPSLAPINFTAVAGQNSVTLSWSKPSTSFTYYLIAYSEQDNAEKYGNPNIGGPDTLSYTVSNLSAGTKYYFKIRTGNGCAPGPFSSIISATPGGEVLTDEEISEGFEPGVLGAETTTPADITPSPTPTPAPTRTKNNNWLLLFLVIPLFFGIRRLFKNN